MSHHNHCCKYSQNKSDTESVGAQICLIITIILGLVAIALFASVGLNNLPEHEAMRNVMGGVLSVCFAVISGFSYFSIR